MNDPMIDDSPTELELLIAVHRLVETFRATVTDRHGPVPALGSPGWWVAPPGAQLAALLPLAEVALLAPDPAQLAADRLKAASLDLCAAHDWVAASRRPSHAEVLRRRAEPGPLAGIEFDPDAAARWVETGDSNEGASAA